MGLQRPGLAAGLQHPGLATGMAVSVQWLQNSNARADKRKLLGACLDVSCLLIKS